MAGLKVSIVFEAGARIGPGVNQHRTGTLRILRYPIDKRAKITNGWGPDRRRLGPHPRGKSAGQLNILRRFIGGVPPWC
jgi:hypothetical protein